MSEQQRQQRIQVFLQNNYTDERLAMLLAHAEDGKLAYFSCCCLLGVATATHPLRGYQRHVGEEDNCDHFDKAYALPGAEEAHIAFAYYENDRIRRRILIPIIRAEMKRRERLRSAPPILEWEPVSVNVK